MYAFDSDTGAVLCKTSLLGAAETTSVCMHSIWSTPAYFNGAVYYADSGGTLGAFVITGAKLSATPASQSAAQFSYPGSAPTVADGKVFVGTTAGVAVFGLLP